MTTESIWLVKQTGEGTLGAVTSEAAVTSLVASKGSLTKPAHTERIELHRPDLRPIYGGPTLLEALWSEMDRLMEGLMTGQMTDDGVCGKKNCDSHVSAYPYLEERDREEPCQHPVEGDKFRAQQLAWVLAIVANPYDPSVDAIRAETMRRWEESQEAAVQEHDNAIRDGVTG